LKICLFVHFCFWGFRRTEYTIDLLAEYDWPQNEPGRNRDSFMIQEQIAEYLGVKSFKRKYPDLVRRTVDMEERNYLFENGLASEKMCDLGLTAVYASEVLDIMCNDYPEKYEEYKRYQREKAFRFARMRLETAVVDRSQMQKDKAITSASDFNTRFNKDRRENRRSCMDLQNFLIQKPTPVRDYNTTPAVTHQSHYPIALVPGQFSEYYEKYTPLQLA
jgi:BRG1-associated factor 45A